MAKRVDSKVSAVTVCTLCRRKECLRAGVPCREVEMMLPKPDRARMGRAEALRPGLRVFSTGPFPHRQADAAHRLLDALRKVDYLMTKTQWDVAQHVWGDGYSHTKTARRLGISRRASHRRLNAARRAVYAKLGRVHFAVSFET